MINDVIIVGAGPAGISASIQCKRLGLESVLVDRTGLAGGLIINARLVENFPPLDPTPGKKIAENLSKSLNLQGIKIKKMDVKFIEFSGNTYKIYGQDRQKLESRSLILCTGTSPKRLEKFSDFSVQNIFYDIDSLHKSTQYDKSKKILIVGGGESSFDYALSVLDHGKEPTIIIRSNKHRVMGILKERVEKSSIKIMYKTTLEEIEKDNDKGLTVTLSGKEEKENFDSVLVAIGRNSTVKDIELNFSLNYDNISSVTTEQPGLFIAGDARLGSLGQLGIAVGDGLSASHRALKHIRSSEGVF